MLTLTLAAVLAEAAKDAPTDYERMNDGWTLAVSFLALFVSGIALITQQSNDTEANEIAREARGQASQANDIALKALKINSLSERRNFMREVIDAFPNISTALRSYALSMSEDKSRDDWMRASHLAESEMNNVLAFAEQSESLIEYRSSIFALTAFINHTRDLIATCDSFYESINNVYKAPEGVNIAESLIGPLKRLELQFEVLKMNGPGDDTWIPYKERVFADTVEVSKLYHSILSSLNRKLQEDGREREADTLRDLIDSMDSSDQRSGGGGGAG